MVVSSGCCIACHNGALRNYLKGWCKCMLFSWNGLCMCQCCSTGVQNVVMLTGCTVTDTFAGLLRLPLYPALCFLLCSCSILVPLSSTQVSRMVGHSSAGKSARGVLHSTWCCCFCSWCCCFCSTEQQAGCRAPSHSHQAQQLTAVVGRARRLRMGLFAHMLHRPAANHAATTRVAVIRVVCDSLMDAKHASQFPTATHVKCLWLGAATAQT